jgi:predicted metal-dependent phosphoesterase TrpH
VSGPDLHIHSTASDGTLAPAEIVARAAALGLPAIAVTDHDTVAGVGPALGAGRDLGIPIIPGVELSADVAGRSVHLLGYGIDHTSAPLLARLERLRHQRVERAERIVASLREGGLDVALRDVLGAADGGAVGRAHIAHALVNAGYAESLDDAFDRLIGTDRPHYVAKPVGDAAEVIGWIGAAGGIAVLAHPALSAADDLVPTLVAAGLAGIEAYHGRHDAPTRERYRILAAEHGLIVTGGSDFHGDEAGGTAIGSADVPEGVLDDLDAAIRAARTNAGREDTP